jgi:hypothetical protein
MSAVGYERTFGQSHLNVRFSPESRHTETREGVPCWRRAQKVPPPCRGIGDNCIRQGGVGEADSCNHGPKNGGFEMSKHRPIYLALSPAIRRNFRVATKPDNGGTLRPVKARLTGLDEG